MADPVTVAGGQHPVVEVLPVSHLFLYGFQHVLSMYAGVVAVLLQQSIGVWKIGARQPIMQGTSFVAVTSMIAIGTAAGGGTEGLRAIFGAVIVAGVLCFLVSPLFTQLLRFFPEVVTGTVITVIGLSLLPVGINWAAGGVGTEDYGSVRNIGLAGARRPSTSARPPSRSARSSQ